MKKYNDPSRKGPVVKSKNKKNRHGTNCNDDSRVIVGMHPNDPIPYSVSVQKSVSHYILKYDLKCSVMAFPYRMNLNRLATENKLTQEFMNAFADHFRWDIICSKQKLSESFMEKHADRMSWKVASIYQSFSKEFILKHMKDLDMDVIVNQRFLISQEEIDEKKEQDKKLEKYDGEGGIDSRFDILDI